ncbi:MAG: hypothetical protein ACXIUB_01965 [Wenzhouxiangella sp.]
MNWKFSRTIWKFRSADKNYDARHIFNHEVTYMNAFPFARYRLPLVFLVLALLSMASISMAVSFSEANSASSKAEPKESNAEPVRRQVRRLNDLSTAESDAPLFPQEFIEQAEADARERRARHD